METSQEEAEDLDEEDLRIESLLLNGISEEIILTGAYQSQSITKTMDTIKRENYVPSKDTTVFSEEDMGEYLRSDQEVELMKTLIEECFEEKQCSPRETKVKVQSRKLGRNKARSWR